MYIAVGDKCGAAKPQRRVPKAKGSKKKDVQRSAMEVATYAQVKKLHKRLGFRDNANTQAVRSNIAHLWFAAQ